MYVREYRKRILCSVLCFYDCVSCILLPLCNIDRKFIITTARPTGTITHQLVIFQQNQAMCGSVIDDSTTIKKPLSHGQQIRRTEI